MIARLGIALALIGLGLGTYTLGAKWQIMRLRQPGFSAPDGLRSSVPAIVYFWSEACTSCMLVQKPVLEQLQGELGYDHVQVIAINALEQPEIADKWGVLGLPTTFVVDKYGQPHHVNHGVASIGKLRQQIESLKDSMG